MTHRNARARRIRPAACAPATLALALALLVGIPPMRAQADAPDPRTDVHSFARPDQVRSVSLDLRLKVDFDAERIDGTVVHRVERAPGAPDDAPLVLDTRNLEILAVESEGQPIPWELGPADPVLGAPLIVRIPPNRASVSIRYRTSPGATALQWLEPGQTAGKRLPFLFSQSQAIHARSWIPIQDSPAVRVTYTAAVEVPEGIVAVMAADRLEPRPDEPALARFRIDQPIPPYLIALAAGDLEFRPLGPRSGVYAEPSVVAAAASEFVDIERMIDSIEAKYGPYRWGRYDILVLPPSFPFGGMENPKLTFATPTILAGDRSLVSLVVHELAHSWSGNLVTNATWRDFWLNEGFTVYLERRVLEDLYGRERRDMEALIGIRHLRDELAELPEPDQILHIDLAGRDPDDGLTGVPYEKGALFLTALENAFGRERFDAFLRDYFDKFAFQSITTDVFLDHLRRNLFTLDPETAAAFDLETWVRQPGLPESAPVPRSALFEAVENAAARLADGTLAPDALETGAWSTHEWLHFLASLPADIPPEKLAALDAAQRLTDRGNAEILEKWLLLSLKAGYEPALPRLERFLQEVGRRKFLMPLYAELVKTPDGLARAERIFEKARPGYHPISADSVERLLKKARSAGGDPDPDPESNADH